MNKIKFVKVDCYEDINYYERKNAIDCGIICPYCGSYLREEWEKREAFDADIIDGEIECSSNEVLESYLICTYCTNFKCGKEFDGVETSEFIYFIVERENCYVVYLTEMLYDRITEKVKNQLINKIKGDK